MGFFEDMTTAVETYPVDNVVLKIVDVVIPGDVLNEEEEGTFRVQVINNGPLNMTGVTVRIRGQHGATVKNSGALASFEPHFITQELAPINAHGGSQLTPGGVFSFKAPAQGQ